MSETIPERTERIMREQNIDQVSALRIAFRERVLEAEIERRKGWIK